MTVGVLDTPTISSAPLPLIADAFEANSIDAGRAFAQSGLDANRPPVDAVIPLRQFAGLLQAASAETDPAPRLWLTGRSLAAPSLCTLFAQQRTEPRLGGLLSGIVSDLNAIQSGSDFSIRLEEDICTLSYRIVDPSIWPRSRDAEFTLGFFEGVIEAACQIQPGFLDAVAFEHSRDSRGEVARQTGLPAVFEEPTNYIAFPASLLDRRLVLQAPAPSADPCLTCTAPACTSPRDAIAMAVYRRVGRGMVSQETVARECGLSERSLRRRLRSSGVSFRDLLEKARISYAQWALVATDLPLAEIANRAGYADQSAFSRAFRRATGHAPSKLRQSPGSDLLQS